MHRMEGHLQADAAIIGGGLTGLLLASALLAEGMQVAVLTTGHDHCNCSAAASVLCHGAQLEQIRRIHGVQSAASNAAALFEQLQSLTVRPVPYIRPTPVYLYARTPAELPLLQRRQALFSNLNIPVSIAPDAGGCPFPVELSLTAQDGCLANVPGWIRALKAQILRCGGRLLTIDRLIGLESTRIYTPQGWVEAPRIIHADGIPAGLKDKRLLMLLENHTHLHSRMEGDYPLHSVQLPVSTGMTLLPDASGLTVHFDAGPCGARQAQENESCFEPLLTRLLPDHRMVAFGHACEEVTLDGLPVVGALSGSHHLCAAGCREVLSAMHAAAALYRLVLGRSRPDDAAFAPDRPLPAGLANRRRAHLAAHNTLSLLHPGAPVCPHCGCRMRYAACSAAWGCPACGSVFDMLGHHRSGPSLKQAQVSALQRPDI